MERILSNTIYLSITMDKEKIVRVILICFIIILLALHASVLYINWGSALLAGKMLIPSSGLPIGPDFSHYYAAAHLAHLGTPLKVYNPSILQETLRSITGAQTNYVWLYPPIFLMMVLPLALLPYLPSLLLWLCLTLAGYLVVIRRLAPDPLTPWLALAFPGAFINLLSGQNGFLSAMILGAGLFFLDRRPRTAGLVLGLLCYKPHLAVLVPVALLAGRRRQALAMASLTALLLALITLLVFGPEVWQAFFAGTEASFEFLRDENLWKNWSPTTLFVTARLWGGSIKLAWALQAVMMFLAGAVVVFAWKDGSNPPVYIKNAVLVLALLLFSPYAHFYDFALLALPIAWLGWAWYNHGRLRAVEAGLLTAAYIMPFLIYPFGKLLHHFPLAPIILLMLLIYALINSFKHPY